MAMPDLDDFLDEVRACRLCAPHLDLGPRPVLRARAEAKLLIVGQAPGTRVHETGVPWNDPSGDRLRDWLDTDKGIFYDDRLIALAPMGFCYPGRDAKGADKPPRPECAPHWHPPLLGHLPNIETTLLVGSYAQAYYLRRARKKTMTETVRAWKDYLPRYVVLPHPSWRNTGWIKRNPWFEAELVPALRRRVGKILD